MATGSHRCVKEESPRNGPNPNPAGRKEKKLRLKPPQTLLKCFIGIAGPSNAKCLPIFLNKWTKRHTSVTVGRSRMQVIFKGAYYCAYFSQSARHRSLLFRTVGTLLNGVSARSPLGTEQKAGRNGSLSVRGHLGLGQATKGCLKHQRFCASSPAPSLLKRVHDTLIFGSRHDDFVVHAFADSIKPMPQHADGSIFVIVGTCFCGHATREKGERPEQNQFDMT